jgi:hypothetical protein
VDHHVLHVGGEAPVGERAGEADQVLAAPGPDGRSRLQYRRHAFVFRRAVPADVVEELAECPGRYVPVAMGSDLDDLGARIHPSLRSITFMCRALS